MRKFVPADFVVEDFSSVEPLFAALLERAIGTVEELEGWLLDYSELGAVLSEMRCRRYIENTCHTDDPERERAYVAWVEKIDPGCMTWWQKLDKKFVECAVRKELSTARYLVYNRNVDADMEVFREANIPLIVEDTKLGAKYEKMCGGMTVFFDGGEKTMSGMARYSEDVDRKMRQHAWEAVLTRRLAHEGELDEILSEQVKLRDAMARNAGKASYVELVFRAQKRFDYSPRDCEKFHETVEQTCVPLVRRMQEKRRSVLGVEKLRPWDGSVDVLGRPALRPFQDGEEMAEKTGRILSRISEELGTEFRTMRDKNLLDLDARPGKAPGGYQATLEECREPFIFMNAAGLNDDLRVLLHEAGHAFHSNASRREPLMAYRNPPIEFAEVASMTMELMGHEELSEIYGEEEMGRAWRRQLEAMVGIMPWIAQIDAFQHWMYRNAGHSAEERNRHWMELGQRFGGIEDWSGYERGQRTSWQRQRHLFCSPLYYIEYGIAELGALQLWKLYRKDRVRGLAAYRRGLALGGSRPLPELFKAAEIEFDFSARDGSPLMEMVGAELEKLPA